MYCHYAIEIVTDSDETKDDNNENIEDNADGRIGYEVGLISYKFWLVPLAKHKSIQSLEEDMCLCIVASYIQILNPPF